MKRLLVALICILLLPGLALADLTVYFLDVGQGDSAVIECDGEYMIIDGGDKDKSSYIYSFLSKHSIKRIQYMIATHPHDDHVGGLPGAFQNAKVVYLYSPVQTDSHDRFNVLLKAANENHTILKVPHKNDKLYLGDATITFLTGGQPSQGGGASVLEKIGSFFTGKHQNEDDEKDVNNTSLVVRIDYGLTSFLFTGDADKDIEKELLDSKISADVLKVSHHGSRTASSFDFLQKVFTKRNKFAVISCGKDNTYKHPHQEALDSLSQIGVKLFRTDLQGTITFVSDGSNVVPITERNAQENNLFKAPQK